MKLGIEMEFWVIDAQGRLSDGTALTERHERIEPEFIDPLIEVRTEAHESEAALRRDLQAVLSTAQRAATECGVQLVPLGTPLTGADPDANCERGELFERIYGEEVASAKNCAGTHVHFERGETARQLNALTALDPALALVSSSPYYFGERCQRSSRARAYRRKCGEDLTQFCDLWPYVDGVSEWESRVAAAFDQFKDLAAERGVDPQAVEEHFVPEDAVLNPVRLRRSLPTVEWRAPDTALPSQVLKLACDVRDVVEQTERKPVVVGDAGIDDRQIGVPSFERLRELSDDAIERGLDSRWVRRYLREMGLAPEEYYPLCGRIDEGETISESAARDYRLRAARWLRADVASMTVSEPAAQTERRPSR